MTGRACGRLGSPCGEQGKLPTAKAFMLAERDKICPQKQSSFMQELDRWTEATVIYPLADTPNEEFDPQVVEEIKKAVRTKVLESYRNGQNAGPRPAGFSRPENSRFARQPQKGGRGFWCR